MNCISKLGAVAISTAFAIWLLPAAAGQKPVLTVYTYDAFAADWGPGPKVKTAFERTCECKLRFVALDSSVGILSRIRLEGSRTKADVALGLDTNLMAQARATGLFADHGVQTPKLNLPDEWRDPQFLPFDFGYFAFVYDTTRLASAPKSLAELIKPNSDLKVIIQDPRSSTPGLGLMLWIKSVYGDKAEKYWEALAPRVVTVTKGWSEAYGLFLKGESDMVLSYTTSPAYHMIAENKHQYRAAAFQEGHYAQIEVAAKLKATANPALADLFLRFMLSKEFQALIPTGNWMYPVLAVGDSLPPEFDELVKPAKSLTLPIDEVNAKRKAWTQEFTRAFSG